MTSLSDSFRWKNPPTTVNAFYHRVLNAISNYMIQLPQNQVSMGRSQEEQVTLNKLLCH